MEINKEKMTAILTLEEVNRITNYLNVIPQDKKNKLTYAATQLGEEINSKMKPFNKKLERLTYEYALKDSEGNFKTKGESGSLIVDPKQIVEYNEKREALLSENTVELELYYCKDKQLIDALPMPIINGLNGILFEYDMSEFETEQN